MRQNSFRLFGPALIAALLVQATCLRADPVRVLHKEGTLHGFLALRDAKGKTIAAGDLMQVVAGDRVVSHLIFRFRDGSLDDERAVFSQRHDFHLITDHHVQKGPSFPQPLDLTIDVPANAVVIRSKKDGKEEVRTDHLELPNDLANGFFLTLLKNLPVTASETKLSYLAATPKARLVKLSFIPQGQDSFWTAGARHLARRFVVKIELGGIAGLLAPLVGKQPADYYCWILEGEAPAFVKSTGPTYLGGPSWTIEISSAVWGKTAASR